MSDQHSETKKGISTQAILIAGIVLILAVVVVFGVLFLNKKQEAPPIQAQTAAPGTGTVVTDEKEALSAMEKLRQEQKESAYSVKMNNVWTFQDGKSPSKDAYVANSESNLLSMYFEVSLDDGSNEILYTSPIVPIGSAVQDITLNRDLEAGSYDAICTYHTLREDETIAGNVSIAITLKVLA